VLVVDDEEMVRNLCRSMVERLGFNVVTASDGDEAVRVFQERGPGIVCVILDLTMPNKDGMETFDELKRMDGKVRVILSSGFNEQDVTRRFLGKGLAGFIKKPYQMEHLGKELQRVLGGR
jgi:CheY-like chemotaxis protein